MPLRRGLHSGQCGTNLLKLLKNGKDAAEKGMKKGMSKGNRGEGRAIEVKCDTQGNNKHSKTEKRTTGV